MTQIYTITIKSLTGATSTVVRIENGNTVSDFKCSFNVMGNKRTARPSLSVPENAQGFFQNGGSSQGRLIGYEQPGAACNAVATRTRWPYLRQLERE